jgi:pyrroline-5-carboxylate reductase
MVRLLIVGGGKMGEALASGLLDAGWCEASELGIVEKYAPRADELRQRYPDVRVVDAIEAAEGAVIAVKPADVADVAKELALVGVNRLLSIAAGVTLATIEAETGSIPVVRAMPNTPAVVGAGASAIAPGSSAGDDDLHWAGSILEAVGVCVRVKEDQLDAVTGLSGSGPAYVFLFAESLIEAGVLMGLTREVSEVLASQTILGSGLLLRDGGESAATHRAAVTSPAGTTAAGLHELELGGVRGAVLSAVKAATEKSRELGRTTT